MCSPARSCSSARWASRRWARACARAIRRPSARRTISSTAAWHPRYISRSATASTATTRSTPTTICCGAMPATANTRRTRTAGAIPIEVRGRLRRRGREAKKINASKGEKMTDTPAPPAAPSASLISTTLVVYALFGVAALAGLVSSGFPLIAPLSGIVGIIGIILAYVKRGEATGTWLASHYRWLIRTFWYSLLWGCIGALIFVLLAIILIGLVIGYIIWVATTIWVLYRLIRGYVLFKDSQPVPGM